MGSSSNDNFCLQWNDFAENVSGAFKELRSERDFFDVTLACTDSGSRTLQAHKVILSACSNIFKSMFRQQTKSNNHPNPYIYLKGVTYSDLTSILDFIYNGEVNVSQEDLNSFLSVAEEFQIKGLTHRKDSSSENDSRTPKAPVSHTASSVMQISNPRSVVPQEVQPPNKKARRSNHLSTPSKPKPEDLVTIKDEFKASTSNVNHNDNDHDEEAVQEFTGGEDHFDGSYDASYYEDDANEIDQDVTVGNDLEEIANEDTDVTKQNPDAMWTTIVPESADLPLMARCNVCNLETRKNKISRHLKEVHEIGLVIHKCPRCAKPFKRRYKFDQHRLVCLGLAHIGHEIFDGQ